MSTTLHDQYCSTHPQTFKYNKLNAGIGQPERKVMPHFPGNETRQKTSLDDHGFGHSVVATESLSNLDSSKCILV